MDKLPGAQFWLPMHPACAQYKALSLNTVKLTPQTNILYTACLHTKGSDLHVLAQELTTYTVRSIAKWEIWTGAKLLC